MTATTRAFADRILRLMAAPSVSRERVVALFLAGLPLIVQECPRCHAMHVHPGFPREGMDDGWCGEECRDADAYDMEATRHGRAA